MDAEGRDGRASWMGKLSIRTKLVLIIMAISALSMMLASGALLVYQEFSFRQRMVRDLETQALMLAANCTAALAFDVRQDAEDLLGSLRVQAPIMLAGVYRRTERCSPPTSAMTARPPCRRARRRRRATVSKRASWRSPSA